MERRLSYSMMNSFIEYLSEDEKSKATISKYRHDIEYFFEFAGGSIIDKALILSYKARLEESYLATSVNSMLAALNAFLKFSGWIDLTVKQLKVQRRVFVPEEKELSREEYLRLVKCAENKNNQRLSLILQTICSTGIRISELEYITVEAVKKGMAVVNCKGKTRTIFIVSQLRKKLLCYIRKEKIASGMVFITRTGKKLSRSNIWKEMKNLCNDAGVLPQKVFPHNLRHLFARIFYGLEKDIAKLADILGHTNINTTRIYIMTTGAEHKRKMENMHLIL